MIRVLFWGLSYALDTLIAELSEGESIKLLSGSLSSEMDDKAGTVCSSVSAAILFIYNKFILKLKTQDLIKEANSDK